MNPVSSPNDTDSGLDSILSAALSAALSPEFASLEPKSSRPTNERAHRVNQSSSSSSSSTNHWQSSIFHMAINRLRAQHASQSQELFRMFEIARTRSSEDDEMATQVWHNRPNSTDAELLQSPHAAPAQKSSTVSSSDTSKHHASGNKSANDNSSSNFAADIGGSSRRQNQKRKGHAARCA